jgi:predicted transcriptional regulator of viral defense system
MSLKSRLANKTVLTHDEVVEYLKENHSSNARTQESLLAYHVRQGNLLRVRRGLYVVVPSGADPATCPVDPFLVAAKLADDAVLAYHTALEFYGNAYSVFDRYYVQSNHAVRTTNFRSHRFECVPFPKALRDQSKEHFATHVRDRSGVDVRVATLERTLVDLLDRPKLGGGWEEVWRSLESVEFFDLDLVVEYTLLLDNSTTAAKVGYYLEQHAKTLMVEESHLQPLREKRPKQPHYLERGKSGKLLSEWNLVVPASLVERSWEDVM